MCVELCVCVFYCVVVDCMVIVCWCGELCCDGVFGCCVNLFVVVFVIGWIVGC